MGNNGTIIGSPTSGTGRFDQAYFNLSDTNHIYLPGSTLPSSAPFTIEARLYTTDTTTNSRIALSFTGAGSMNLYMGSYAGVFNGEVPGLTTQSGSTSSIADGAWHHCVLVVTSSLASFYVDGVLRQTLAGTYSGSAATSGAIGVLAIATGFTWPGGIDEVAIFTGARYTSNFTPPTSPYTGSEANLVALYHFDGNATDSTSSPLAVDPTNAALLYSPGNWDVKTGLARTNHSGAYLRTLFTGTSAAITFNTAPNSSPFPQVWGRVDNGPWQKFTLAAGNPTWQLATGLASRAHLLELIVKSRSGYQDQFTTPAAVVQISGLVFGVGATLSLPLRRSKTILVLGDSISEGDSSVFAGTSSNDPDGDDVLGSYSYALSTAVDAEVGIIAFPGTGIVAVGASAALPSTYNKIFADTARSISALAPDLIIYNQGTNDGTTNIVSAYTGVVQAIMALAPNCRHLLLRPFNGNQAANVQATVTAIADPRVTYVDTTGWWSSSDSPDGLHPYGYAQVGLIAPKLFPIAIAALYPQGRSYTFS